jgi:hypothetical protein
VNRIQKSTFIVGLIGLAVTAAGALTDSAQFFRSYLMAYVFWIGLALGCLAILMVHHLAGGRWGFSIRRMLEAGTKTLPVMALLFIPLIFGMKTLYPWANPEIVKASELLRHKLPYLNAPFFYGRTVFYFVVWLGLTLLIDLAATAQDERPSQETAGRVRTISAIGLAGYMLTMSFASFDWVMSLDPIWHSSIFGVLFLAGQVLGAFAVAIIVVVLLMKGKAVADAVKPQQLHDLGNFLFTFVVFWAYISLSQFLIIWSGNLPEEVTWYLQRFKGGWGAVGLTLVALHFAVPFLVLLSRDVKRNPRVLATVAAGILVMCVVDVFWIVKPGFQDHASVHWLDLAALVGLGGIWVSVFIGRLKSRSLVPVHDARVETHLQ